MSKLARGQEGERGRLDRLSPWREMNGVGLRERTATAAVLDLIFRFSSCCAGTPEDGAGRVISLVLVSFWTELCGMHTVRPTS